MLRNYFLTAIRFFGRQRFYSLLNLFGLTIGLVCTLLIVLWVNDEVQKNRFHTDLDRIYNVSAFYKMQTGEIQTWSNTPGPTAEYIREFIPDVEAAARFHIYHGQLVHTEEKSFLKNGYYADPDFFSVFSFRILKGTPPEDPLDKSALVISNTLAQNLFGNLDPLGKPVTVAGADLKVVAVFEDVPDASSLKFDFITPLQIYKEWRGTGFNWGNFDHNLFIKLKNPAKGDNVVGLLNKQLDEFSKASNEVNSVTFFLRPLRDYYLHSNFKNGILSGGRILYVRIFSAVAAFILLIACVNFTNMATARALNRGKEIGVRKVVGAARKALIWQFLSESFLMSLGAMILAVGITWSCLPLFNMMVEKHIVLDVFNPAFISGTLSIVIVTALLAGWYPALLMSSFKPTSVLKGVITQGMKGNSLRKWLVTFQFSIAVVLIICAIVVFRQIEYIRNKNLGFDRTALMKFNETPAIKNQFEAFQSQAVQLPGVLNVSRANESLVSVTNWSSSVVWPGKPEGDDQLFKVIIVDYGFKEALGLSLLEGRSFSKEFNDENNILLSERAANIMGMSKIVGQKLSVWQKEGNVVGIISDIQASSLQNEGDAVVLVCRPSYTHQVFVKFDPSQTESVIAEMTVLYKKFSPEYPFDFRFLDQDFEDLYRSEKIAGSLALGFTGMSALISVLGMLGLAAYTTERRRKEIGIRKSLGASVPNLIRKMTSEFVRIAVLASVAGSLAGYLLMSEFLDNYAHHVEMSWTVFGLTMVAVTLLAAISVSYQVGRAAMANPAEVLRSE